jgi:hypothetical protein
MAGNLLDPNLSYGWTNQQPASSSNLYGGGTLGYGSVSGVAPAIVTPVLADGPPAQGGGLALAGTGPYIGIGPYGAVGNANAQSLTNQGYAASFPTFLGQLSSTTQPALPAVPLTTVAVQNPSGLAAQVTLTGGTVTVVAVAAWAATAGAATFNTVATATGVTIVVPSAGFIKLTYSSAPTWVWITTN